MVQGKTFLTASFFGLLALLLVFLWLNSPVADIQRSALFDLLLLIGGAYFILQSDSAKGFFEVKNFADFRDDFAVGVIAGFVSTFVLIVALSAFGGGAITPASLQVFNLTGSANAGDVASYAEIGQANILSDQLLFTVILQPIVEVIILVGGLLAVLDFIPKTRVKNPVLRKLIAFVIVSLFFAMFHFVARGANYYSFDPTGLWNFATDTTGLGSQLYHGAVPQLLMGFMWIGLALFYESWVVAVSAHLVNNALAVGFMLGFGFPLVFYTLGALIIIAVLTYATNGLSGLKEGNIKNITGNEY